MERRVLALAAPLTLGLTACNLDLPSEYRIEDLRVLDLQVEPPEVSVFEPSGTGTVALSFDPMNPPPIAHQPVRVRALVAHPDLDASFEYDWIRCKPGLDRVPCDGSLASALVPERSAEVSFTPIDVLFADVSGGTKLEDLAAALAEDPRDLLNGLYAYVNLQAGVGQASVPVDTQRIQATKRIVIFDPRVVALALEQAQALDPSQIPMGAGLPTLCAGVSDAQLSLLNGFLASREPNRTPRMLGVSVVITHVDGSTTSTITSARGSVIDLEDTDVVTLEGVPASSAAEAYGLIDANCLLQSFTERLAFSWFISAGGLSRQITTQEDTMTRYDLPRQSALAGSLVRTRVWVVLRDGRGGSSHGAVDFRIRRPPS